MKIIIAGAGEVGIHLAKQLSIDNHDIQIMDVDESKFQKLSSSVDIVSVTGSSTSIKVLKEVGVEDADLVVAVTSLQSVNLNTCMLAKKLGAKKTIARVGNSEYVLPEYTELFKSLGVDFLIYPEESVALEIVKLIERATATDVLEFEGGKIVLLGLRLDRNSTILRRTMRELSEQYKGFDFRIVAIHRGVRTLIPTGNDILLPNDQIFVISVPGGIEEIIRATGKDQHPFRNVMILGGGKIGRKTAQMLEHKMNVKLLEPDKRLSGELTEYLDNTLIINSDGKNLDLLAQEGIIDMDAFISLTEDAETNIISCLMAKHLKVPKTIALVDNVDYIALTQTIGLDALINKKLIAANSISQFIRRANVLSIASLQGVDAEVLEFIAHEGSIVTKKPVRNLGFPKNSIIGGYIRGEVGKIVVGDTLLQADDKVVVFTLPGEIAKVEKFFI
ncbi:MAG: Trk system potassium transporter TrkA [Ignavibacteriales bacterium]|nr:Trk system potassium transporter TrkA [Ignavibacteriales bacterium]MCF8305533.1 Trk system potassium transporter TrkA [Ignavibacteriales bacterium]MCF8315255.1 Trk system potassium transporter TrkA [Ignavibacteriales bacterium]MCF8436853.1 Trk system potassium transporter TrkA [Ignavibacteriales bacterium]